MSSLQQVNPRVRNIRTSSHGDLQVLAAHITDQITLSRSKWQDSQVNIKEGDLVLLRDTQVKRNEWPMALVIKAHPSSDGKGGQKPFNRVMDVSSGDPHRAGIKPLSFVRQVLAVCLYPELLHDNKLPPDVRLRAQTLLEACEGESVGSYSASSGLPYIRQSIAEFITRRDAGVPSYPRNIFISAGSQRAVMIVVKLLASGEGETQTGVLTPIPCPHTLPMLLDEAGVTLVPYHLREDQGWAVELEQLQLALRTARGRCRPRAIYISNPGNPTGHVQDRKSIEEVIRFAASEGLFLLVDEVYQDSVYGEDREFVSYKKVLFEMDQQYSETVELASFHSLSNAIMGECGLRAGYMELVNMDPVVMFFVDTMLTADISTPITGQLTLELMVNPPTPGESSYDTYRQEILFNQVTLAQNAQRAWEFLNDLPAMSCQPAMGGIYLYPLLDVPPGMIEQAKMVVKLLASGEGETQTGVLTPIPCPHTLPMLLDEAGVTLVPYHLREDQGWAVELEQLQLTLRSARGRCRPRAIYISNPGNPTGHVQDRKSIEEVIRFAASEGLFLLVDEVYQDSVYGQGREFVSYKKVLFEMGQKYSETVELASFHSLSNAIMGECGLRGAYMEVINMDPAVMTFLKNLQAANSPAVLPQLALELMVNPLILGDPSYETYTWEILFNQVTLAQNAQRAWEFLNDLPAMSCQPAMGGIYLYPLLDVPPGMIEQAKIVGVEADVLYCRRLLEEEGVCVGPGCDNGQADKNYHLRICILVPPATLDQVLARLSSFHLRQLDTFSHPDRGVKDTKDT
ncbi:alanine aminotransferase 2-like [Diretmus argenteus]